MALSSYVTAFVVLLATAAVVYTQSRVQDVSEAHQRTTQELHQRLEAVEGRLATSSQRVTTEMKARRALVKKVTELTAQVDQLRSDNRRAAQAQAPREGAGPPSMFTRSAAPTPPPPPPTPAAPVTVAPWSVRRRNKRTRTTIKEDTPHVEAMMRKWVERGVLIPKAQGVPLTGMSLIAGNYTIPFDKFQGNITVDSMQTMKKEGGCWEADEKGRLVPAKPSVPVVFCALVRNRVKITVEWVMWHHMLGVQHFEIFDDGSEDGLQEQLALLVALGVVTYHTAPTPPFRFGDHAEENNLLLGSWDVCRRKYSGTTPKTWLGFIDSDEFVLLLGGNATMGSPMCIPQAVVKTIDRVGADNMGGVALPWRSALNRVNDADTFPSQWVRTNFNRGMQDQHFALKTIVRADLPLRAIQGAGHATWLPDPFEHYWVDGGLAMHNSVELHQPNKSAPAVRRKNDPCPGYLGCVALLPNVSSPVFSHGFLMHFSRLSLKAQLLRALDGHSDHKAPEPLNIMDVDYFFRNLAHDGFVTGLMKGERPLSTNSTFSHEEVTVVKWLNSVLLKGLGLTWDGVPAP